MSEKTQPVWGGAPDPRHPALPHWDCPSPVRPCCSEVQWPFFEANGCPCRFPIPNDPPSFPGEPITLR